MTERSIYENDKPRDHIDRLCDIIELAKVGAAATDTTQPVAHINAAFCCVFETIHNLACEALDVAEPRGLSASPASVEGTSNAPEK